MAELARLDAIPPPPAAVEHLWAWWHDLHAGRRYGWGPEPIGYADIEAWSRLTGAAPRPAEVRVLLRIDREWLTADARRREAQRKTKGG